ncbi:MAG: HlyD family efflux transporter periplasmic adaptor subunit [Streptococcus parasanguinis]
MNDETKGASIVAEGTPLAQVYPLIQKEKEVKIVTYIPSKDIATIHVGDRIRFSTQGSKQKTITLEARISSIASSATRTEQGNFFKIEGVLRLKDQEGQTPTIWIGREVCSDHRRKILLQFLCGSIFRSRELKKHNIKRDRGLFSDLR